MRQAEGRQAAGLRWEDHDLVFCNGYGKFISPPKLRENFAKLLRDSGLPRMRFHDLRHSSATLLLAMGIHAKVVQELLGHSNITITLNVYSHVLPSMQQDAVEKMSNLFAQQDNRSEGNESEDDQKKRENNTQEE
jgi:integrase